MARLPSGLCLRDILTPMKTKEQIAARISELRHKLKTLDDKRKRHARETGANRSNLAIKQTRELEGEIAALEWVLDAESTT